MTDPDTHRHRPAVDPAADAAFDKAEGHTGQGYTLDQERALGERLPAGSVAPRPSRVTDDDPALPPDNGKRASFDPVTGEVRGSGAGAGGGNPGEDFEQDHAGGDAGRTTRTD